MIDKSTPLDDYLDELHSNDPEVLFKAAAQADSDERPGALQKLAEALRDENLFTAGKWAEEVKRAGLCTKTEFLSAVRQATKGKPIRQYTSSGELATIVERGNPTVPQPTDDELATSWKQIHPLTAHDGVEFRRYAEGVWSKIEDKVINAEIIAVLVANKAKGVRPTASRVDSVKRIASDTAFITSRQWDADPDLLVCRNGTLHIPTLTLRSHSPTYYQTTGLPFNYDPGAVAPTFDYVLKSTIPEAADFLQEFAGYALITDTRFEIAVWLYGPPGCGKSTFIEGLRAMLGNRAGLLGLADIEKSRFALADLPGKTLVVSTEQPSSYMTATHTLNSIISGEPVTVDRKYREAVSIVPKAKLVWAMNDLPRVPDAGNGLFRRVKVVAFPPLANAPDPRIKQVIAGEGAGILNWALEGLVRLRNRSYFEVPQCIVNATSHFKESNDVPALFVAECCCTGLHYSVQSSQLYSEYKQWCIDNGHKPQSATSLASEWERLGFEGYKSNGRKFFRGIGLPIKLGVAGLQE